METILIAGGTGLIGQELSVYWKSKGHQIRLLTRGASNPEKGLFNWNPTAKTIDQQGLENVTVLVNLCGAGIADKRWTTARKQELFDSRIGTTECLWEHGQHISTLKHYLTASGAVCYGFENNEKTYTETDAFGDDLLSVLTRDWEAAASLFNEKCTVTKVRISVVLAAKGGALPTIAKPIRMGFGTVLGSGKQAVPWIHLHDLIRVFDWSITQSIPGAFNANAGNTDNGILTHTIARVLGKKIWLPNAPAWAMRLVLGAMSVVVLKGVKVSSEKLKATGFQFQFTALEEALKEVLSKEV